MARFRSVYISEGFGSGPAAGGLLVTTEGQLKTNSLSLRRLVGFAYDVQDPDIDGPDALESSRFSITGEPEIPLAGKPEMDDYRAMLRTLLEEQFRLNIHRESQTRPVLELRVASAMDGLKPALNADPGPLLRFDGDHAIEASNITLAPIFTSWLSNTLRTPIVDRTGLEQALTFKLSWAASDHGAATGETSRRPERGPLEQALAAQLGLALVAAESTREILIVDSFEVPADIDPAPEEATLDPAQLATYAGRYAMPGAVIVSVHAVDNGLILDQFGFDPIRLVPSGAEAFFSRDLPVRCRFVCTAANQVREMVLYQGGQEIRATRLMF